MKDLKKIFKRLESLDTGNQFSYVDLGLKKVERHLDEKLVDKRNIFSFLFFALLLLAVTPPGGGALPQNLVRGRTAVQGTFFKFLVPHRVSFFTSSPTQGTFFRFSPT